MSLRAFTQSVITHQKARDYIAIANPRIGVCHDNGGIDADTIKEIMVVDAAIRPSAKVV